MLLGQAGLTTHYAFQKLIPTNKILLVCILSLIDCRLFVIFYSLLFSVFHFYRTNVNSSIQLLKFSSCIKIRYYNNNYYYFLTKHMFIRDASWFEFGEVVLMMVHEDYG